MKKLILIFLVAIMFTGCSKTVSYKYNEAISQNGDWSAENGKISIKNGGDLVKFKVKYIGEALIEEGESRTYKVLVCKNNEASSIDNADIIFTTHTIYGKEMAEGDIKVISTENDVVNSENDYDFNSVYLQIEYTKNNEDYEDIIELLSKN
ncbi:MAG: hypothetical protein K0R54_6180 [Clostridiaceae bacterium]|jgi:signal peptidase I|nr:hypothetical protein [Clostridiaceae bacterium]